MKVTSVSAIVLAVGLLASATPARGDYEAPPIPIEGWEAFHAKVVYPEMAQKAGMEGEILLHVYVDANGQVKKMDVVKGSTATGFVEAACDALQATTFKPGQRSSTPVGMWISVRVVFSLNGS